MSVVPRSLPFGTAATTLVARLAACDDGPTAPDGVSPDADAPATTAAHGFDRFGFSKWRLRLARAPERPAPSAAPTAAPPAAAPADSVPRR